MPSQTGSQGSDGGGEMGASPADAGRSGALRVEPPSVSQAEPPVADAGLARCPFCGGEAACDHVEERWAAGCADADCLGFQSIARFARKAEATKAWNARAGERRILNELRAKLEDRVEAIADHNEDAANALRGVLLDIDEIDVTAAPAKALGQHLGGEGL